MSVPGLLEPTGPNRSLPRTGRADRVHFPLMSTPTTHARPEPEQRPNPMDARTPDEFLLTMRLYLVWAGDWSYLELEYKCGGVVSAETFRRALEGTNLPGYVFLMAFVTACVGTDEGERLRWATSWHRLRRAARAVEDARPSTVDEVRPG
ncbi:hypothetical protein [Nocardiopsis sp. MG754419]|uniref:hypothetical protein n=1 Tax=Nocardiopsis sp. MG754419 TaxID=2259865 RepID=UPI001BAD35D0|nr:hypothetical protein [Nocardiopsis sp. MG754419]MBR8742223.1 hypothetical protein [Nocardiopsis sp. MG754419]